VPVVYSIGRSARGARHRRGIAHRRLGRRRGRFWPGLWPVRRRRRTVVELEWLEEVVEVRWIFAHSLFPGGIGIVARVPYIALTRIAEPWSMWNLIGVAVLVLAFVAAVYWLASSNK
jgi:hypothetical protein